jgi:hypothetical protein
MLPVGLRDAEAVGTPERDPERLPDMDGELLLLVEAQLDAVTEGERALVAEMLKLSAVEAVGANEGVGKRLTLVLLLWDN